MNNTTVSNGTASQKNEVVLPIQRAKEPGNIVPAGAYEYELSQAKITKAQKELLEDTKGDAIRHVSSYKPLVPRYALWCNLLSCKHRHICKTVVLCSQFVCGKMYNGFLTDLKLNLSMVVNMY